MLLLLMLMMNVLIGMVLVVRVLLVLVVMMMVWRNHRGAGRCGARRTDGYLAFLALTRARLTESLCEWIVVNLELRNALILIRSHCDKFCLLEYIGSECASGEIFVDFVRPN